MKYLPIVLALLLLPIGATASILNPSDSSGVNGYTWEQQFQALVANSLDPRFNTTQTFSNGTATLMWVPKYSSSTACGVAQLDTGSGICATVNMSRNVMVTDEFSEVGIALAMSNRTTEFVQWYNTLQRMNAVSARTNLPSWKFCRNETSITDISSDSASDATVRIIRALYIASQNDAFSTTNRTAFLSLGNTMSAMHYQYENKKECYQSNITGQNICVWLSTGEDAAASFSSDPFVYGGYFYDAIAAMLAACAQTSNNTYCLAASNYTAQMLTANYNNTGGGSTDFRVSPFSWRHTSAPPVMAAGNTYHFDSANPQWDDSDRPRGLQDCDILRIVNISYSGSLPGVYTNLSTYCSAWSKSGTYTNTTTCLQYYFNGTCAVGPTTGYYQNGLGALLHTYYNMSQFVQKVNETISHYSYSGLTFDSTSCGNALTYRGVRPTKSIGVAIGKEESIYSLSLSNSINIDLFYQTNSSRIYDNMTITIAGGAVSYTNYTTTGTILYSGLPDNSYTVTISGSGFTTAQYTVTVSGGSIGDLDAYLTTVAETGNNSLVFTIKDSETALALEGALATMSTYVGGALTLVESKTSDITGRTLFYYTADTRYSFTITKDGYEGLTFVLDPVLFSTYDIQLQKSNNLNFSVDTYGTSVYMNTSYFFNNVANSVLFTIASPDGILTNYSVNFSYPGGSNASTGTVATGENINLRITPAATESGQKVELRYCITTQYHSQNCAYRQYDIIGAYSNSTLLGIKDRHFGMGVFDRVLLASIIIIVLIGIVAMIAGSVLAAVTGAGLFMFFSWSGFIPGYLVALPVIIMILIVSRRSSE